MRSTAEITRRHFVAIGAAVLSFACAGSAATTAENDDDNANGRLRSRPPKTPQAGTPATGAQALGLDTGRDGVIYIPEGIIEPAPLMLLLHGATGSAAGIIGRTNVFKHADALKMVVVVPDSRKTTWDAIRGVFGPDAAFIDRALGVAFSKVAIDPKRIGVAGFSDGATYALSLGLVNGDLFTHVAAFSPGFFVAEERHGTAKFFISHGQQDEILAIATTSRRIVPVLEDAGYDVTYREFNGPHTVPPNIAQDAFEWIAGRKEK
jgi:phospholipase/carboxylesterase